MSRLWRGAWVALGLLAAYVAWVGLSLLWSAGPEATLADLGRVLAYLGVFALALALRRPGWDRRLLAALALAIALVGTLALLSRLEPAWFPGAAETARFLPAARDRLAYPLGYWNGVASLLAIGLPLVLHFACCARGRAARALAAAALPALVLAVYLTFSRGGALAALVALVAYLALAPDRFPKAATALLAAAGSAVLIVASDGGERADGMLPLTLLVCAAVGLGRVRLAPAARRAARLGRRRPPRRVSLALLGASVAVAAGLALALGAAGGAADAWDEFRQAEPPPAGAERLGSFSGNGRWPLWRAALDQAGSAPLAGQGAGSFERWWARHGTAEGYVRDAHSLYFETLGELGVLGLAPIVAFLGWVLVAGTRRWRAAEPGRRALLAAALAGCAAFCLGAGFDWLWELAAIPAAFLLLASVLVGTGEEPRREAPLPRRWRAAGTLASLAAIAVIAIPLSANVAVERSRAEARAGDLEAALREARGARRVEPFAAGPRIQEALMLEAGQRLAASAAAAREAARLEPEQWRAWAVLSRIEARRGNPAAAIAAYRRARELSPRSPLLRQPP